MLLNDMFQQSACAYAFAPGPDGEFVILVDTWRAPQDVLDQNLRRECATHNIPFASVYWVDADKLSPEQQITVRDHWRMSRMREIAYHQQRTQKE